MVTSVRAKLVPEPATPQSDSWQSCISPKQRDRLVNMQQALPFTDDDSRDFLISVIREFLLEFPEMHRSQIETHYFGDSLKI
jgi:hypothetical protein